LMVLPDGTITKAGGILLITDGVDKLQALIRGDRTEFEKYLDRFGLSEGEKQAILCLKEFSIITIEVSAAFSKAHAVDKEIMPLYHGTSSSRASKIVGNEVKVTRGFNSQTYFAEDFATAEYFSFESIAKYPASLDVPKSLSVIEFKIPKSLAKEMGLLKRHPIGSTEGLPFVDISGGTGFERILSGKNIKKFNEALKEGKIIVRRKKI